MSREEREVRWERMFPDELEAAFRDLPVVYFPYGLCEPHGPHCVLGLDALKAHGLLVATARRHGGIVAPPDYWHVHEIGRFALWAEEHVGQERPWLTAVPPWIHFKNVCYHLRAAEVLGFRAAILLTGHYGPNWHDLKTLVEIVQPSLRMRVHGLPDFEANRPGFRGTGADGDHAGKVETSLLWALEPGGVDPGRLPSDGAPRFAMGRDAPEADREAGEAMVADVVEHLGALARDLLAGWDPERPSRLRSFDDVEELWRREVAPRMADFKVWNGSWTEADAPAEGSRWRLNFLPRSR